MTNDHREINTTVKPGEHAAEEQAPSDELSPPIFSDWDPAVDTYQLASTPDETEAP
ncbi:hypothetical protein [Streptomyces canus]|uniref:hypothetical protein n=1 Tax=Streptomyces canus TaxID=58343 RepID=UPI00324B9FE9